MKKVDKLIGKYKAISLPAKASFWYIICSMIQKGISFFTTPFFTRALSTEEYGETVLYSSWLEIITIFATFQLATGVFNKAMIKYEDDREGYTSSSLFLASIITSSFFIVYLIDYKFWSHLLDLPHSIVIMMFIDIFFSTAMSFWSQRNRFEYRYKSVIVLTLSVALMGSVLGLLLINCVNESSQAEAKIFGLLIIKVLLYSIVFLLIIKKGKKIIAISYWKYSLAYNFPLIPHYLSQQILTQSDRIMINNICGKTDAAVYGVAYQLSMATFIFTYAIHSSFSPWTFEKIRDKQYEEVGKKALLLEGFIGVMCFGFSLFAPELIYILGGGHYRNAVWIVPPVAMSILFQTIYSFFGNVEFYYEKTKFVMVASIICAIANLVLNAFFIPLYGFVAAGYTTLFCYIFYSFAHFCFMKKILKEEGVNRMFKGKLMWLMGAIFVILSIFSSVLYLYTVIRYLMILVFVIIMIYVIVARQLRDSLRK